MICEGIKNYIGRKMVGNDGKEMTGRSVVLFVKDDYLDPAEKEITVGYVQQRITVDSTKCTLVGVNNWYELVGNEIELRHSHYGKDCWISSISVVKK